jgi:hypothetical protein
MSNEATGLRPYDGAKADGTTGSGVIGLSPT